MKVCEKEVYKKEVEQLSDSLKQNIQTRLFGLIDTFSSNSDKPFLELELSLLRILFDIGRDSLEKLIPLIYGTCYNGSRVTIENEEFVCLNKEKERSLKTIFGKIKILRAYYHNEESGTGKSFLDERVDIENKKICPASRYWSTLLGTTMPFEESSTVLRKITGVCLAKSDIENYTEKLAMKVTNKHKQEILNITENDQGKIEPAEIKIDDSSEEVIYLETDGCHIPTRPDKEGDSKTSWKECKTILFFQKEGDRENYNIANKLYYSTLKPIETFKKHVKVKLEQYCKGKKVKLVCIGDGAQWIWNMLEELVPNRRTDILDWYHVEEKIWVMTNEVISSDEDRIKYVNEQLAFLKKGNVEIVIQNLELLKERQKNVKKKVLVDNLICYYEKNKEKMRYAKFKEKGYCIGSGAIESANKYVVQRRLKLPGIRWYFNNADSMAHLRAEYANGDFDSLYGLENNPLISLTA